MLQGKDLIDVEANYNAQLAQWIRLNTGIEISKKIRDWSGEPFTAESIYRQVKALV